MAHTCDGSQRAPLTPVRAAAGRNGRTPAPSRRDFLRRTTVAGAVCASFGIRSALGGRRGADAYIARIEALPRSQRLVEYPRLLRKRGIPAGDRLKLVSAFAKHARYVSPLYGRSSVPLNMPLWAKLLEEGWKANPADGNVCWTLCRILIDHGQYERALPILAAHLKDKHDLRDRATWDYRGWQEFALGETGQGPDVTKELREFGVHLCVISNNPGVRARTRSAQLRKQVDILNRYFVTLKREKIIRFTFRGATAYAQAKKLYPEFVALGDSKADFPQWRSRFATLYEECPHEAVRDRHAVNVYIYDNYCPRVGFKATTCRGVWHGNHPYNLIDWERLDHVSAAQEHEMGHAFGIHEHVAVPGATSRSSTNIMCGIDDFGHIGRRDLGFTDAQRATILHWAKHTAERLGRRPR